MHKAIGLFLLLGLAVTVAAPATSQAEDNGDRGDKVVFVMTNDAYRNAIIAFRHDSDGSLTKAGKFFTGGRGSGGTTDPLGSQGSLTLSADGSLLFAVNAGSESFLYFAYSATLCGWLISCLVVEASQSRSLNTATSCSW